jgi:DNA polymerase-3 subunit gamma/tau
MTYQAIARKWRPTTFDEIAGQAHVTRTLVNAIKLGRVHHAFLFAGPRGVGKTTAARALARALNCAQGPTPSPCGTCGSCKEILVGSNPDVIEIDGASNNSVDDIRELRESVRYMPVHGKSKIYIVDEVHMLSKGAFNALLKTLEEPPPNVVFMFATTEPQRIPDTILSRVQRFDFKRIPPDVVVERLAHIATAEGIQIGEDALRLIARAGEGSMRDAQSLLDQVISFAGETPTLEQVSDILGLVDRSVLYQMLEGILVADADACLGAVEAVYGYGFELSEFTSEMLTLIRNATLVGLSPKSKKYLDVPSDERERLEGLVKRSSTDVLVRAFHVMLDVHDQVARSSRPRLVLEMAVARLVSIRPAQPIDRLLHRLDDLEHRIRVAGGVAIPPPRTGATPRGSNDDKEESPSNSSDPEIVPESVPALAAEPVPEAEAASEAEPVPEAEAAPEAEPVPEAEAAPEAEPVPEAEAASEAEPVPEAEAAPEAEPVPEAEAASEAEPVPEAEAASEAEPVPEAEAAPEAEPVPEAEPDAIPIIPVEATPEERFLIFRAWLEAGGPRYEVWAKDCIFLSAEPPHLHLEFPEGFRANHVSATNKDARLLKGVAAFFDGCTVVTVRNRADESERMTHRETVTHEAVQAQAALERLVADNADIGVIAAHFDGAIRSVHADHRAPVPPALSGEEGQ